MKVESEFFIPEHSSLLTKLKSLGDIEKEYHVEILHVHNDPVFDINSRRKVNLERELAADIIVKVTGDWDNVARLRQDCLNLTAC